MDEEKKKIYEGKKKVVMTSNCVINVHIDQTCNTNWSVCKARVPRKHQQQS